MNPLAAAAATNHGLTSHTTATHHKCGLFYSRQRWGGPGYFCLPVLTTSSYQAQISWAITRPFCGIRLVPCTVLTCSLHLRDRIPVPWLCWPMYLLKYSLLLIILRHFSYTKILLIIKFLKYCSSFGNENFQNVILIIFSFDKPLWFLLFSLSSFLMMLTCLNFRGQ